MSNILIIRISQFLRLHQTLLQTQEGSVIANKCTIALFSGKPVSRRYSSSATISAPSLNLRRGVSTASVNSNEVKLIDGLISEVIEELSQSMRVVENFISEEQEQFLMKEIEPYIKRLRYEFNHWDNAIHGYRETEKTNWNSSNTEIINNVREFAFPPGVPQLRYVHVLDLSDKGLINPHVDSVRFCGDTIAGLSLLSDAVMRLAKEKGPPDAYADVLLPRRSLYIMTGPARYLYTHAILASKESVFRGRQILRERRVSVICRNEPIPESSENA